MREKSTVITCDECGYKRRVTKNDSDLGAYVNVSRTIEGEGKSLDFCSPECMISYFKKEIAQ